ncbi:TetR family transcriptional regulator [Herbaspirillum lusitanum]|uniref:TetR family transcriptional regulator n=1 Tax=Herbaspirillum lusitanum TaxID=213312 RepID=UPI00223834B4|nr:TetR family transcriptional regulator [Herbaspirillum lusitanum]
MSKPKMTEENVRKSLISAKKVLQKKGGKAPSVSAICKEAAISRAHVYASFPQLIDEFSATARAARKKQKSITIDGLKKNLKDVQNANQLLARSCIELRLALTQLQSKYQRDIKSKRKVGGRK